MRKAASGYFSPNGPMSACSTSTCRRCRDLNWRGAFSRAPRRAHHHVQHERRSGVRRAGDQQRRQGLCFEIRGPLDLVEAIREVGKGGVYLPPAIAQSIAFAGPAFAQSPLSKLTSREIEILRLLSAGKSLSEIAWLVHSSYKTIANTSSIIRQKLGLRSASELVRFAIESRLV